MKCVDCGREIGPDDCYAEYEDGPVCLECDDLANPLPADGFFDRRNRDDDWADILD
jgi:NAD-dependent SIR2 family protein deacetylase